MEPSIGLEPTTHALRKQMFTYEDLSCCPLYLEWWTILCRNWTGLLVMNFSQFMHTSITAEKAPIIAPINPKSVWASDTHVRVPMILSEKRP